MKYDLEIYVDGASSGNPGPAGIGGIVLKNGQELLAFSEYIGEATNNMAEYKALLSALERIKSDRAGSVKIKSDSELMVKQLKGQYKTKNPDLRELGSTIRELLSRYDTVDVKHIPRDENTRADSLANDAISKKVDENKGRPKTTFITFISDFGQEDGWTGIVKSVVLEINPKAKIIDIAHDIKPFDINKGAFVLSTVVSYIKPAIHLAVIDPGVGGQRQSLAIETVGGNMLVGPDNGLLIPAAKRDGGIKKVVSITSERIMLKQKWSTFNARDVFAPAAAHLSAGADIKVLGQEIEQNSLVPGLWAESRISANGVEAEIIDIDRFGTARLSIPSADMEKLGISTGSQAELSWADQEIIVKMERTFSDVAQAETVALVDSSGYLCIAVNRGSAAEQYRLKVGQRINIISR